MNILNGNFIDLQNYRVLVNETVILTDEDLLQGNITRIFCEGNNTLTFPAVVEDSTYIELSIINGTTTITNLIDGVANRVFNTPKESLLLIRHDAEYSIAKRGFDIENVIKSEDTVHTSGDYGIAMFGLRSDSDASTADDGDYTLLKLDEQGRLKVSSKPASFADVTGDITTIQATIGTPVVGGTVIADCSRASNVMAFCTGTFAGINCTFEGSLQDTGENWFGIQAVRTNANTIETTTGVLGAMPTYAWEMSVNALKRVRVRATARTSGTQSWRFTLGTYATEPIPASQVTATQPISGSLTSAGTTTNTPTTPTASNINSAATTNATSIKASAGTLYNSIISNTGASTRYVKFYNKASAPTVGTDVPVITIAIPTNGTVQANMGVLGHRFATGIALAITGGATDADTTVVGANEVKVLTSYI
jgi:hypothetical protein